MNFREVARILLRIEGLLIIMVSEGKHMADTLDDVLAEATAETTVDASLLVLINTLQANQNDPAKISAILAKMKANISPLADALVAGTPNAAPAT